MIVKRAFLMCALASTLLFPGVANAQDAVSEAAEISPLDPSPPGCVVGSSTPEEKMAARNRVMKAMLGPEFDEGMFTEEWFAPELRSNADYAVFGNLWGGCGLSRRDRSLVTLGILIATRSEKELGVHFKVAQRNGLTKSEIEQVLYQSAIYAGYPATLSAREIAEKALGK